MTDVTAAVSGDRILSEMRRRLSPGLRIEPDPMSEPLRRTVQVGENGRMSLPAEMRRVLGLTGSGRVILTQDEEGIRITAADPALKRVRALAAPFAEGRGSVVDAFITEKRAEAAREDAGEVDPHA